MSREPATLIVLAGGEAKRLGFPKHRLTVEGERILNRLCQRVGPLFVETVVVGRGLDGLPDGVRTTEDCYAVRSPLVGIYAGYRKTCIEPIERLIEDGTLKVSKLYEFVDLHLLDGEPLRLHDPELRSFLNLNTANPMSAEML